MPDPKLELVCPKCGAKYWIPRPPASPNPYKIKCRSRTCGEPIVFSVT